MPSRYNLSHKRRFPRWLKRGGVIVIIIVAILIIGGYIAHHEYSEDLEPADPSGTSQQVKIASGSTASQVAEELYSKHLLKSKWAFEFYLIRTNARGELKAGTYNLSGRMNVGEIVSVLTHGKVASELVTILPGSRLDQVRASLEAAGFSSASVTAALNPSNYTGNPALVDKPASANLEGFLYPDSFARVSTTRPEQIIEESLSEMAKRLTPQLRASFAAEGLNTYQGITLASIVEQEVPSASDRAQVAQVFLSRLKMGMPLQSDVATIYGDRLADQPFSTTFDTPYNVYLHTGLPPTPISNVTAAALSAVAHPASTGWLYFVTGNDCKTHFATTEAGHEQNIATYGNGCKNQPS